MSARSTRHSLPLQIILQCSKPRKHSPMGIIGSSIKPFSATSYHQGKFVPVTDADVAGKWAVFFFYPADFTFVCPTELDDLADQYETLQGLGVEVYSVSTDTHFSHQAWHDSPPAKIGRAAGGERGGQEE